MENKYCECRKIYRERKAAMSRRVPVGAYHSQKKE
jgi:hypothetical protein